MDTIEEILYNYFVHFSCPTHQLKKKKRKKEKKEKI